MAQAVNTLPVSPNVDLVRIIEGQRRSWVARGQFAQLAGFAELYETIGAAQRMTGDISGAGVRMWYEEAIILCEEALRAYRGQPGVEGQPQAVTQAVIQNFERDLGERLKSLAVKIENVTPGQCYALAGHERPYNEGPALMPMPEAAAQPLARTGIATRG